MLEVEFIPPLFTGYDIDRDAAKGDGLLPNLLGKSFDKDFSRLDGFQVTKEHKAVEIEWNGFVLGKKILPDLLLSWGDISGQLRVLDQAGECK